MRVNNPHHPRFISAAGEAVRDIAKAVEQTPGGAPAVVLKLRYEYCALALKDTLWLRV